MKEYVKTENWKEDEVEPTEGLCEVDWNPEKTKCGGKLEIANITGYNGTMYKGVCVVCEKCDYIYMQYEVQMKAGNGNAEIEYDKKQRQQHREQVQEMWREHRVKKSPEQEQPDQECS